MFGVCEICGETAEIAERKMPMFLSHGRYQRSEVEYFHYHSCARCERDISPDARNRKIAWTLGILVGIFPLVQLESVDWVVRAYLGRWVTIAEFGVMISALFLLMALTKGKNRHFERIEEFRVLREKKFELGHKDLKERIGALVVAAGLSAMCVFTALCGIRLWQDGWTESRAVVTACEVRSTDYREKNSSERVYRLVAKYRYGYEVGGNAYSGTGYGALETHGERASENPWAVGRPLTIVYAPSCPRRSASKKTAPLEFGKNALFALSVFVAMWFCQVVSERTEGTAP